MNREQQAHNPIDKIFSQKLANYQSSYSPTIWDGIQSQIQPVKNSAKPAILFWLTSIGLIGLLLLTIIYFNGAEKGEDLIESPVDENIAIRSLPNFGSGLDQAIPFTKEDEVEKEEINFDLDEVDQELDSYASSLNKKHVKLILETSASQTSEEIRLINEMNNAFEEKLIYQKRIEFRLEALPSLFGELHNESNLDFPKQFAKKINPSDCPSFSRKSKGEMSVDLYYSSDYPLRTLSSVNSEFDGYALARNNTETELYSFSAGIRASYHMSPSVAFRAGIHFSQINERFNFVDPDAQQVQTIITIDSSFVNGMWQIMRDTQTIRLTGIKEIQHHNRYKMIDIPVLLSYEMAGEKFDLALNGGIMLNLMFKQKGRFLNASLMPAEFDSGDPNQFNAFKTNVGLSLYGGFTFAYKLNNQWSLLIEPNVRHYLGQVTLNSYPLKQSYTTVGLMTGVRYHF